MRYLKVLVLVLVFFIVMMFFVQNQQSFADTVVLKLDLLLLPPVESIPLPMYSVMLCCFALGALIVLMMLLWDRMTLSSRLISTRRRAALFEKKYTKAEAELNGIEAKNAEVVEKLKADLEEAEKRIDLMRDSQRD